MADGNAGLARRVESATLNDLREVDIDDVYVHMDHLLESRATPIELYDRWENQNWKTQDLDFSEDVEQWKSMTGPLEGLRVEIQRTCTLFFIGEQAVTDTLSPLVHAAPDEPSRIFLSTQLVDEARHAVFFSRFFEKVTGIAGGLSPALATMKDRTVEAFKKIFDNQLVEATDAVRDNPDDYATWVEGIIIYHLIIEGMLALTGQKFLLRTLRKMDMLPGFRSGFTAVARDESRHVNFGVRAVMEAGIRDRTLLDRAAEAVFRLLRPACYTISAPDRKFAITPDGIPEELRISPYEIRDFAINSLTKRLRVAGFADQTLREVERRALSYFDAAWEEYEERHHVEHPRRFYDRLTAAG